jgi:hypothetical protein
MDKLPSYERASSNIVLTDGVRAMSWLRTLSASYI